MPDTPNEREYTDSETALGGADSVEKTTYVTGSGTDPEARQPIAGVTAKVPAGGGINVGAWIVGGIALLIAAVYALGIFR